MESDRIWVGIDIGKRAHHAVAVDATGNEMWSVRVIRPGQHRGAVEPGGLRTRCQVGSGPDVAEAALLLSLLAERGQRVVYVPGRVVNRMSGAFRGEGKTDARDASTIAQTARLRSDLAWVRVPDDCIAELGILTTYRSDLVADWVARVNRLRSLLLRVFPALEGGFDLTTRSGLSLVARFCTPQRIRDAGADAIAAQLRSDGVRRPTAAAMGAKAHALAQSQTVTVQAESVSERIVTRLAAQLLDLDHEIKELDKEIANCFRRHPAAHIVESVPGIGTRLGAELLAIIAGDLNAYGSAAGLAAYAGLAPVPNDSGARNGVLHRPRRYHRRLRHVFFMAAFSSSQRPGPSRDFYQRKRAEGKRHIQAMIALARRLVDVLWALLRDGREWEPAPPSRQAVAA